MIYANISPVSPHSVLVGMVAKEIANNFVGTVQEISANISSELRFELERRASNNCLLSLSTPDREIAKAIVRNGVPALLVIRPFSELSCYAMARGELDLLAAIRHVTCEVSCLHPITRNPNLTTLSVDDDEPLSRLAVRIGVLLGFPVTEANLGEILGENFKDWRDASVGDAIRTYVDGAQDAFALQLQLSYRDKKLLEEMDGCYLPLLSRQSVERLNWPLASMFVAEPPYKAVDTPIEMLGPARILTFGPYFHLPEGGWVAEIAFSLTENYSGNSLMVDVYTSSGEILAASRGELPSGGTFSTRLSFRVASSAARLELRTFVLAGALEGRFEILSVTLIRAGVPLS